MQVLLGLFVFGVQAAVVVMIVSVIIATPFALIGFIGGMQ